MGARQDTLTRILGESGYRAAATKPARLRLEALGPHEQVEILRLYRHFGGVLDAPRLQPGAWDCPLEEGLIVELDESQHFNRYRRVTLKFAWAQQLPWRDSYLAYASQFEDVCVAERGWGGYWKSVSTERMFGPAGPSRTLDGAGSPRWKQRALYDAMRDMAALGGCGIRLARLSVYDRVGGARLDDVLDGRAALDREALRALINQRTIGQ